MPRESAVAERMRIALELAAFGEAMFRQRMRRGRPELSVNDIEELVDAWRQRRPGAELGDAQGKPRHWPPRS